MHYRMGYCPQCNIKLMVQDTDGRWNSVKKIYKQADITLKDGHKIRTIICSKCLENPNFDLIIEAITHEDSTACTSEVKDRLKNITQEDVQSIFSPNISKVY